MYRLNSTAREQNTDEHNPPAQPSMNPVRARFPSRRHQENFQHSGPTNASTSQHGKQMGESFSDSQHLHKEQHLLPDPKCSLCFETAACGHTFCWTCVSQHWTEPQAFRLICPICRMQGINTKLYPEVESSFPLEHKRALPLIFVDHTGNIKLNMAAVENYFMRDTIRDIPVYLLSVAGEKRTGKSFLMNYMIRALKCQVKEFNLGGDDETLKGFEWKSGTLGTTKGVWIWSEPFIMESNGKKVALFLLDSEGLMDIENNRNISTKLFSLVMLLSTHLIYNVKNGIDEKEMDYLEIYLHQAAQRAEKNKQYLDIVVRDWHDCENCGSKAANSYLKEQVEILRKKSSISPAVLEALENPNTKCFLMPYPGKKIAKSNTGIVKDMDEDFQKSLKGYLESVIKRPKNPSKTGAELAEMLKGIIGDLQGLDFEFSSPQEMSDKYLNSKEMRTTLEEFQQFLLQLSSIKLPGAMRECISGKSLELVKNFEKSVRGNNADMRRDLVGQLRTTLQKEGDTFYSNYQWQGIKYACSALLLASGPVGGMMFAGEAAVAATTTGFLPTAISYGQYVTALIAGRFLGRWL